MSFQTDYQTGAAGITGAVCALQRPSNACYLKCVKLHLSSAGGAAESFVISIDSAEGAAYDVVLHTTSDMTSVTDVVYLPDNPIPIAANDKVICTYTNTNTRTWGVEFDFEDTV